ncbi:MAG: class II aldolase/adducin family protein [Deltaproteobacteria bacterium]|nr:class II aldolase/adducin family protein [Deltaproteobacteria bacterium]
MNVQALRREVARISRRLWERGWVANHDGNVTVRLEGGRVLATPTAVSKGDVREEDVLVLDGASGKVLSGARRPFSELYLHLEAYRVRDDVHAVVHAHCPVLCSFAVAGLEVDPAILPEAVVSLGPRIPLAPPALPGSLPAKQQIQALARLFDVILLSSHGPVALGADLEQAYLRLELAEHVAGIQQRATWLGGARRIPEAWLDPLLKSRRKAGLGPEARGLSPAVPALADAPVEELVAALVRETSSSRPS